MLVSLNPATGAELARFEAATPAAVEAALAAAAKAQPGWRRAPVAERTALLRRLAAALRAGKAGYARLITLEMGKPLSEAEAEVEKCAVCCDFYAEKAEGFLADRIVASNATDSRVAFDPLGVVLAIMPWNFPFWQFFRFAAPALAAGNGFLLKHASNVPQCALAIADVLKAADAPEGLGHVLLIGSGDVAGLIKDPRIAAVTLTGSTQVGAEVAALAGAALKKQVLELGGSDPFIVLADADVEAAAATAVKARYQNAGQSCIAAKRFIVEDAVAERFVDAFVAAARKLVQGDGTEAGVTLGPMARINLRDDLVKQVDATVAAGAKLLLGGKAPDGPGAFYPATVLDRVEPGMPAFDQETFGPAAAIVRAKSADAAIALANRTQFGLGSALWTTDLDRAAKLAREIDAGSVFVNGMVASDPRLPFGGVKHSGYGRELGDFGIHEFVNVKTVWTGPAKP